MTKQQLPPEDLPEGHGLVPASTEDVLAMALEENPPGSAWRAAVDFYNALTREEDPQYDELYRLVTPESLLAWGDFIQARDLLLNTAMATRAEYPAPDAAYVKFLSNPGQSLIADSDMPIMVRVVATLQFRPELGQWRVHALGGYCLPEDLP
jgi:hypothetical protein